MPRKEIEVLVMIVWIRLVPCCKTQEGCKDLGESAEEGIYDNPRAGGLRL